MKLQTAPWILVLTLLASLTACSKDEPAQAEKAGAGSATEVHTPPQTDEDGADILVAEVLSTEAVPASPVSEDGNVKIESSEETKSEGEEAHDEGKTDSEKPADAKKSDKKKSEAKSDKKPDEDAEKRPKFSELGIKLTTPGKGMAATSASRVTIHYRALLADTQKAFDSSSATQRPLEVDLDPAAKLPVIEGLRRGLAGVMPGSEVRLEIPANLAWGEKGNPAVGVPANADVIFEVTVLDVQ